MRLASIIRLVVAHEIKIYKRIDRRYECVKHIGLDNTELEEFLECEVNYIKPEESKTLSIYLA